MDESVFLGRLGGVRVGLNWSLLPVFVLVTWSLAAGQLPAEVPGYPSRSYWVAAVVTAATFFASLLAHELSHAVVARRHGMRVKGIVLWLFGGVAQLEGDTPDARAELRMAAVGPATSLVLGAAAGGGAWLLDHAGQSPLLVASVAWLAAVNVILGLFNLLPAFPLDGGRVLRALLWRHWNDRLRATAVAATAGRFIGYGLMAVGGLEVLAGGALGGIWLGMIGWFVSTAAAQQRQRVHAEQEGVGRAGSRSAGPGAHWSGGPGGLRVADAMTPRPVVVPATATVAEVVDEFVRPMRFSAFPVGEAGRIVGLTTVDRMGEVPRAARSSTAITAAAAPPAEIVACRPADLLEDVAVRIMQSRDRRAIVIDEGRLVGILAPSDVAGAVSRAVLLQTHDHGSDGNDPAGVRSGPGPRS